MKDLHRVTIIALAAGVLLASIEPLHAQMQGVWATTGTTSVVRAFPASTALNNGGMLVAGGSNGTTVLSSAEVYSPATGHWTPTGSMAAARYYAPAVLLPNGNVLVAGGLGSAGKALASAELYNSATGKWSSAKTLAVGRFGHTATLLRNGKVLVTGGCTVSGCSAFTAVSELYDPATNSWSRTGKLVTARYNHTAAALTNGKALVVGGSNGHTLASSELYDPASGTWRPAAPSLFACYLHAMTVLKDGMVLVTGGQPAPHSALASAEIYNPVTNTWKSTGSMIQGRFAHSSTLLSNGTVLVAAGAAFRGCGRTFCYSPTYSAEIYNEGTGRFTATASLNAARMYHQTALLRNGQAMVVGGNGFSGALRSAEIYTPLSLKISSYSLDFGLLEIGLTSAAKTVAVTNVIGIPITFTGITAAGDYAETQNCTPVLNPGKSCTLKITFTPKASGTLNGSVTLSDNSAGSPHQVIALTGTGEPGALALRPNGITLPDTLPGNTSAPITVTLTNDSFGSVSITAISVGPTPTFKETNTCPATLNPGQSCPIYVAFSPPDSILYTGSLRVSYIGKASPQSITLTGTGLD
jgi:N-acetylneuraminic acid mutarotase